MFKVRNRLLIAMILFAIAFCACLNAEAGARTLLRPGSNSSYGQLKPGAMMVPLSVVPTGGNGASLT